MGKTGGFLEHGRQEPGYRPVEQRVKDFKAVEMTFVADELHGQLARCLECGTPFCHGWWSLSPSRKAWEFFKPWAGCCRKT